MKLRCEDSSHFTSAVLGAELLSQGSLNPHKSSQPLLSQSLLLEKPQCRRKVLVQSPKIPEGEEEEGEELNLCVEMNKKL